MKKSKWDTSKVTEAYDSVPCYWDQPIKRNRKEQLTLDEIEYRHEKNSMDQMEGWPTFNVAKALINEVQDEDPNITLLNEIIEGAHQRIAMYEMLQNGMWYATFRTDATDEILRERELIKEFKRMKEEIIEWQIKNTTEKSGG